MDIRQRAKNILQSGFAGWRVCYVNTRNSQICRTVTLAFVSCCYDKRTAILFMLIKHTCSLADMQSILFCLQNFNMNENSFCIYFYHVESPL